MDKKIQYRQIDFLRLFRLCKQRGIVKRKRKTPAEYGADRAGARGAGKRLLRSLIKELFPNFGISGDFGRFFLTVPAEDRDLISNLSSLSRTFFANAGDAGTEALSKFEELRQNIDGHVAPAIPYEIKIHVGSSNPSDKYNNLIRQGISTNRPRENFYNCAIACIKFKKIWDENVPFLRTFYERESRLERQREEEAREAQRERRRAERERLLQERAEREERERERIQALRQLEEQIENERISRVYGAQSAFDRAMQQYMRDDDQSDATSGGA